MVEEPDGEGHAAVDFSSLLTNLGKAFLPLSRAVLLLVIGGVGLGPPTLQYLNQHSLSSLGEGFST